VRAVSRRPAPWLSVPAVAFDLSSEPERLRDAVDGADAVVHLAGVNEAVAAAEPDRALAETVVTARQLGAACTAAGVRRIVYVSTVHVYGAALVPGAVVTEDAVPEPRSVYAVARLAAEHLIAGAGTDAVVVRLTNGVGAPVGPQVDRWSLVANDLCRQAVTDGELRLRTDGLQWRDFVALDDVCRVLGAAIDPLRVTPGTYNFGSGEPCTVRALAELVADVMDEETGTKPPLHAPEPSGEPVRPYVVSSDRLATLGLRADVPLRAAIEQTVRFCLTHGDELERGQG
jgi:UDP-glucose 4-epimerase